MLSWEFHTSLPEKNQLFKLRGSEFLPVENTPITPGSYNYKPRPQLSSDGNYTYRTGERDSTGQYRTVPDSTTNTFTACHPMV